MTQLYRWLLPLVGGVFLACGGDYSGGRPLDGTSVEPGGGPSGGDARSHFDARVQEELDFCRTCHVPDGVADTNEGRRFLLSADPEQDYDRTFAAWETLGQGVETNLLLTMPAGTDERSHSGGEPWPPESQAYADVRVLLQCWDEPDHCEPSGEAAKLQR